MKIGIKEGYCVNDINAFVKTDSNITVCANAASKTYVSELLREKLNSSSDSLIENMNQISDYQTKTIGALNKIRRYLKSIQGTTHEEFNAMRIFEKKSISRSQYLHQSVLLDYFNVSMQLKNCGNC